MESLRASLEAVPQCDLDLPGVDARGAQHPVVRRPQSGAGLREVGPVGRIEELSAQLDGVLAFGEAEEFVAEVYEGDEFG